MRCLFKTSQTPKHFKTDNLLPPFVRFKAPLSFHANYMMPELWKNGEITAVCLGSRPYSDRSEGVDGLYS